MSKFEKEKRIKSFGKGRKESSFKKFIDETLDEDEEIKQEIIKELSLNQLQEQ